MSARAGLVLALAAVVVAGGGCGSTHRCKHGTVLLRITLPDQPVVDEIDLTVSVDGVPKPFQLFPMQRDNTLEIDFTAGYPAGSTFEVAVDAKAGGVPAGHDDVKTTLVPGCDVIDLTPSLGDMSQPPDGASDGGDAGPSAQSCMAGDVCQNGGPCVDGYCCDSDCTGLCQACDVAAQEGHCAQVVGQAPHGSRSCDGDSSGVCTGVCDGTSPTACTYPTVECQPASCAAGVATLAKQCADGACPAGAAVTQTCHLGGCFGSSCLGVVSVAAGRGFACVALTDGSASCWGDNSSKQIGQGTSGASMFKTPTQVSNLTNAVQVAATASAVCARLGDGTVDCWGDGSGTPSPIPTLTGATFLGASSGDHWCAVVAGGELRCWGANGSGQLGNGVTAPTTASPQPVCAAGTSSLPCPHATGATSVWGSDNSTCAVLSAGAVACWGSNSQGQLAFTADNNPHPFATSVPGLVADTITGGNSTVCATAGGQVKCWGGGGDTLGSNQAGALTTPTAVCTAADCSTTLMGATSVSSFDDSACAVASGAVRCWGTNDTDLLGDGTSFATKSGQGYAATISVPSGAVANITGGQSNYAIIVDRADRFLLAWGEDAVGDLGDNSASGMPSPSPVEPKWK